MLLLVAYFLHFALPSLAGGFNVDEMTNLYVQWYLGMVKSLWTDVCFWEGHGCPGGPLYYLSLYHFFSLDSFPYRVVQIGILTTSIPMVYYLASLLFRSRSIAFLGVLAFCYHAQLAAFSVHWFVHLRRVMRLLLFSRIGLLHLQSGERTRPAASASSCVSVAIHLRVELERNGSHTSGDRFDIRGLEMSSFRRVEAARSEQLAFCDSRRARRPPYGSVYLRQDDEPSYPSNTLSVSTPVFMAQFRNKQRPVR